MASGAVIDLTCAHGVVAPDTASVRISGMHGRIKRDPAAFDGMAVGVALGTRGLRFLVMTGLAGDIRRRMELVIKGHLTAVGGILRAACMGKRLGSRTMTGFAGQGTALFAGVAVGYMAGNTQIMGGIA